MNTARFAATIVAVEIALVLVVGALIGTVGLKFGGLAVDPMAVLSFLAVVGVAAAVIAGGVTQRREIAEGARGVADDPAPLIGVAVVGLLAAGTVGMAIAMIGPTLIAAVVGVAVAAGLVAVLVYAGPRVVVDRPMVVAGAFVGAVVLLFVLGVALGRSGFQFGGLGLIPGPIVLFLLLFGGIVGAAVAAFFKREQVREGARLVSEHRYHVAAGLVGGILVTIVVLSALGVIEYRFGGFGINPGPVILVAALVAVVFGAAYAGRWYRQREEGEEAEA